MHFNNVNFKNKNTHSVATFFPHPPYHLLHDTRIYIYIYCIIIILCHELLKYDLRNGAICIHITNMSPAGTRHASAAELGEKINIFKISFKTKVRIV